MKFYSSARNFIYCRRNSPLTGNKSAAAAKIIRWLQRIILGVLTYQRRKSYIEEEHNAQKKKFISWREKFRCNR
jgi:hypothetical protein